MTLSPPVAQPTGQPAGEWVRCPNCSVTLYEPRLRREQQVCPDCGHHHRIGAGARIDQLVDPGSWVPAADQPRSADPLGFSDTLPYPERVQRARRRSGLDEAAVHGTATIDGRPVVLAAMDFRFLGGSMGSAVGEVITRGAEDAIERGWPYLILVSSGGARMQEGCLSLMQLAKTAQAMGEARRRGILTIGVLADPTYGGVTASFATLADVLIAEPGAMIGFAGPRVIENATRERLPEGFQTAEYLHGAGMIDRVEPRKSLRSTLTRLLILDAGRSAGGDRSGVLHDRLGTAEVRQRPAAEVLKLARQIQRPVTSDYLEAICDDFVELHGDRTHGDDPAVVGGLASIGGRTVMVLGHEKGHDTATLVLRNFGMPQPEGYRKALRLLRLAERLDIPVITFVDTQGAAPGVAAEERGQAWAIAECIAGMAELTVPVISVITGEGGSGGALALAVGNRVLMLENACYSVISPESCSTILYGHAGEAARLAETMKITAPELIKLGVIDAIVPEPDGGAHTAPDETTTAVRSMIMAELDAVAGWSGEKCRQQRYDRFRALGVIA
ncbi:acetyl-CoA carboxylase carboxyltransferase subunit alpha [Microlunatus parietis]|uniref:Multifunctional fusion protein n=1 Tax=Microlunatus parietis TaxID=682979 RepID=A0A7Y9IAM3_9ACTN|nr:acetyl-CoA carboxylase carboxyltransferase subunit alpha [Microlunatus parietis]NYE73118.1 acetyl-CoA carboxylase carboxyl transferase subunit beta [Microlunatus parietis]